jgi:hypothetical protein
MKKGNVNHLHHLSLPRNFFGSASNLPLQLLQQVPTSMVDLVSAETALPLTGHLPSAASATCLRKSFGALSNFSLHFSQQKPTSSEDVFFPSISEPFTGHSVLTVSAECAALKKQIAVITLNSLAIFISSSRYNKLGLGQGKISVDFFDLCYQRPWYS